MNNLAKGAELSSDGKYRFSLWRKWSSDPLAVFCMLNPSTADAEIDDPTITRCMSRAKQLGYGGIEVVNLFAYRSTDPKGLYMAIDPVGEGNDWWITQAIRRAGILICAWGAHGSYKGRDRHVYELARANLVMPYALKINRDGSPGHPLYVGYTVKPQQWGGPRG